MFLLTFEGLFFSRVDNRLTADNSDAKTFSKEEAIHASEILPPGYCFIAA